MLFYYVDIKDGIQHIGIMFGVVKAKLIDANAVYYFKEYMGFIVVGMLASIPWKNVIKLPKAFDKMLMWLKPIMVTVLFVASLAMLVGQSYNPFLYFRF